MYKRGVRLPNFKQNIEILHENRIIWFQRGVQPSLNPPLLWSVMVTFRHANVAVTTEATI